MPGEEINAVRLRSMLTSHVPVVRQRGLAMLREAAQSAKLNSDPEIRALIHTLMGPTVKTGSGGKMARVDYDKNDQQLRASLQRTMNGLRPEDRTAVQRALSAVLQSEDAERRKLSS